MAGTGKRSTRTRGKSSGTRRRTPKRSSGPSGWPTLELRPLKIDVDHSRPLSVDEMISRLWKANRELLLVMQRRSPSGKGWHVLAWVYPEPVGAAETVALQLLMGSDPQREAYNLNRAVAVDAGLASEFWEERWNVLYGREK